MNFLKKIILIVVALTIVASLSLTLIGCPPAAPVAEEETTPAEEETTPEAPPAEEEPVTFVFNAGTEPPTADPALAEDSVGIELIEQMFMGLTDLDAENNTIPELATEWTLSEDGLEYTFKLRDDVTWVGYNCSTGEVEQVLGEDGNPIPVTANDVVYGVRRTLDPANGSYYAGALFMIKNAKAVFTTEEEITPELLETIGVEAVDDYTVKFILENPAGYFPQIASMWSTFPMPVTAIEGPNGDKWTEPCYMHTCGPYVMSEWIHGDHYTLIKNPFYPMADDVQIEKIVAYMIEEASTELAMYENDEIDCTLVVPLAEMDRAKADPVLSKELVIVPRPCTYYYGFTNNKPPVDNHLVRKAFTAAIDRQTLIDTVLKGEQTPANAFANPAIFGNVAYDPEVGIMYDPEKAKAYLAEAGYPDGEGFPDDVILMHNVSEGHARIAAAIQSMWKDVLNVDVKIETMEWKVYLDFLKNPTSLEDMPHMFRMGWCMDYADQNNWVHQQINNQVSENELRRGCLDPNCTKTEELEFDKLTAQAEKEQDPEKRKELYKQAEIELNNVETAIANIYFYSRITLTKPWLTREFETGAPPDFRLWKIDMEAKNAAIGG